MRLMQELNDEDLMSLLKQGDQFAFDELYSRYWEILLKDAYRILKDKDACMDVLQEVFAKVWSGKKQLPEITDFKAWLGTITRNCVFNLMKKRAIEELSLRNSAIAIVQENNNPVGITELRDLRYVLHAAINELPLQQQKVFKMGRIEGLKHAEIASHLGISKETVKKHMIEAIKNVKKFLSVKGAALILLTTFTLQYLFF